jgi:hypothetical protein
VISELKTSTSRVYHLAQHAIVYALLDAGSANEGIGCLEANCDGLFCYRAFAFEQTKLVEAEVIEITYSRKLESSSRAVQSTPVDDKNPLCRLTFRHQVFHPATDACQTRHLYRAGLGQPTTYPVSQLSDI